MISAARWDDGAANDGGGGAFVNVGSFLLRESDQMMCFEAECYKYSGSSSISNNSTANNILPHS